MISPVFVDSSSQPTILTLSGTMNRHLPTHDKNRKEKRKRTKQQKSVSCTENSNREGHEDKDTMAADAEDAEVHK